MEQIGFEVEGHQLDTFARYALLHRLKRAAARRGVSLMGFALGTRVRLLLDGSPDDIADVVRFTKMGTVQAEAHRGRPVHLGATQRLAVWNPYLAVVQLHRSAACPLADPWTSHRDLLGYRSAGFYDASVWALDPRWVHIEAGGGPLPVRAARQPRPIEQLLQVSGAVLGVLPADRRCFGLFAHLATRLGHSARSIGDALMVTPRRVRQLRARPEPLLQTALICAADPRLSTHP